MNVNVNWFFFGAHSIFMFNTWQLGYLNDVFFNNYAGKNGLGFNFEELLGRLIAFMSVNGNGFDTIRVNTRFLQFFFIATTDGERGRGEYGGRKGRLVRDLRMGLRFVWSEG